MKKTARKCAGRREERPLFDPIHKPAAPPGRPLARVSPGGRGRKTKHGRPPGEGD
jgi:hypothetical protein